MKTIISNNIRVFDPTLELFDFCDKNLKLDNPDYIQALRMGRYIGKMSRYMRLYEVRDNSIILPFGVIKEIYPMISSGEIVLDFSSNAPINLEGDIKLYPYQQLACNALYKARNGVLEAPCGSGKTQIGLKLIKDIGKKALWVTHTLDLITQAKSRAQQYFTCKLGEIVGGKVDIGDITFATVQTLSNLDLSQYKYEWDIIIVDECHKVVGSPTRIMQFYKVLSNLSARYKFGLSATLHRADRMIKSTFAILGNIAYKIKDSDVGDKTIQANHQRIELDTPASVDYLDTDGTMIYNNLISFLCENEMRTLEIAKVIRTTNNYGLVLSHRVEHCYDLRKQIGFGEVIVGATPKNERERIFGEMREGKQKLIISTYSLAKEGLDLPILDRLYLATPHKDFAIVKQSAGRIERNIIGKKQPIILDFVDKNIYYCEKAYRQRKKILSKRY